MTIKELKEIIKDLPDEMFVFVDERKTEFHYGLVNSAKVKEIHFAEEPNGEPIGKDEVLLISEE